MGTMIYEYFFNCNDGDFTATLFSEREYNAWIWQMCIEHGGGAFSICARPESPRRAALRAAAAEA